MLIMAEGPSGRFLFSSRFGGSPAEGAASATGDSPLSGKRDSMTSVEAAGSAGASEVTGGCGSGAGAPLAVTISASASSSSFFGRFAGAFALAGIFFGALGGIGHQMVGCFNGKTNDARQSSRLTRQGGQPAIGTIFFVTNQDFLVRRSAALINKNQYGKGNLAVNSRTRSRTLRAASRFLMSSNTSLIMSAIAAISASFIPRVVTAGVPMRMPLA